MREIAIKELNDFLKEKGFKKTGLVWYLKNNDIYLLCEYQGSRISKSFYLNFGLYFSLLTYENFTKIPKSDDWHFVGRYNQILKGFVDAPETQISLENTETDILLNLNNVKVKIEKFILPYLLQMQDYKYFKDNFPDDFNHDKLWLQNIRENDFIEFVQSQS